MIHLSEDKSAYGTLKGLVATLTKDVENKRAQLARYSPRSQDYAACKGAIGALNETIGLIYVTDVWTHGLREETLKPAQN